LSVLPAKTCLFRLTIGHRVTNKLSQALALLHQHARPAELAAWLDLASLGQAPGPVHACHAGIARTLGHDHALALALWDTGIPDARIVAGMVAEPPN